MKKSRYSESREAGRESTRERRQMGKDGGIEKPPFLKNRRCIDFQLLNPYNVCKRLQINPEGLHGIFERTDSRA